MIIQVSDPEIEDHVDEMVRTIICGSDGDIRFAVITRLHRCPVSRKSERLSSQR